MPLRPVTPLLLALLALVAAGCGQQQAPTQVDRDVPAVTVPGTDIPYEAGGADGAGSDGSEDPRSRGGVAAGPDTSEPGEQRGADEEQSPPRGPATNER